VSRAVSAQVSLGSLLESDVAVELVHGPVGEGGELMAASVEPMVLDHEIDDIHRAYVGRFSPSRAGRYGYTVRVLPAHEDLVTSVELGLIAWS
jgi:starch phosphorylase